MKRIILGGTVLTAFALAAAASMLGSRPSPAAADSVTGKRTEAPSAGTSIAETGRPPVPIVRKHDPTSPSASEASPTPPASGQGGDQSQPAMAMAEPSRVPMDPQMGPNPGWGNYPDMAPSAPIVISRGSEPRYLFIPIDDQRVLIVSQERAFAHGERWGKKEKRRRRGGD